MAASVRIEDEAFSDVRYEVLANVCGLADDDHARGKMAKLWRQCTAQKAYVLPVSLIVTVLGENGVRGLVESRLGEVVEDGIRIRGTRGRIEWLSRLRKNSKLGGKAKAAKRQPKGNPKASQDPASTLPPPCPPAPAPAPALPDKNLSLAGAHAIPPSTRPVEPSLDQLWSELETERQRVAAKLGMKILPLVAHDSGRADLARMLADATAQGKRPELAAQVRNAIAVAGAEASDDPKDLQWFSGVIFRGDNFRRLAAAPSPRSIRRPPNTQSEPQVSTLTPEERIALAAESRAALYGTQGKPS